MKYLRFCCAAFVILFICACQNNINQKNLILTGWGISEKDCDKFITDARKVGFDALITWSTDPDFLKKAVEAGDRNNISIFSCITPMDELRGLWDKEYPELPLPWQVMTEDEAELTFYRNTLVDYINYLADYARSRNKDIKTSIHIWPVFAPDPLYGNLLTILGISCKDTSTLKSIRVVADLNIGQSEDIRLCNGDIVKLSLLAIDEVRDSIRNAMRAAYVKVSVDGEEITLSSGNYNLPVTIGKVQIDCPVTKGYYSNADNDFWKLSKDARFRLWPRDSSYITPGTLVYPVKQKWFASMTQLSNEPCYVDWGENSAYTQNERIYYHAGHDIGGAEGFDEIVSATDGLVVSSANEILESYDSNMVYIHPDAVTVIDGRGWFIEYAHLDSIFPAIKPGESVKMGQKIGYIGKQGSSGGWVHLHFEIRTKDIPAGDWGIEDAYPYMWETFVTEYNPPLVAVARPHHLLWNGQEAILDGRKSKGLDGDIVSYEWTFCDGTKSEGAVQKKSYEKPGEYSEILKVTDSKGNVDYDFTVVQVYDRKNPGKAIPVMQPAYHPTLNIKPGDPVTFLVRTFNTDTGNEVWDFGDGSPQVMVKSYVDPRNNTKGKFAETLHSFTNPGHYIVRVERSDDSGLKAISHLHVDVNE